MTIPQSIAGYHIERKLSSGGMGMVLLASRQGSHGFQKKVAIKVIVPEHLENEGIQELFTDEARLAALLSHPNICQVFDFGQDQGLYYLVMEYVEGLRVLDILRAQRKIGQPLPQELAARIIADAARGLHYAHELTSQEGALLGVVHRDVSPENIIVTYEGFSKVLDFGIARWAERITVTRNDMVRGKAPYMSPEQVQSRPLDRRCDVFALGILLFELCTSKPLFRRYSITHTMEAVLEAEIPDPVELCPDLNAHLSRVIKSALIRDPEQRLQSAQELTVTLEQAIAEINRPATNEVLVQHIRDVIVPALNQPARIVVPQAAAQEETSSITAGLFGARQHGTEVLQDNPYLTDTTEDSLPTSQSSTTVWAKARPSDANQGQVFDREDTVETKTESKKHPTALLLGSASIFAVLGAIVFFSWPKPPSLVEQTANSSDQVVQVVHRPDAGSADRHGPDAVERVDSATTATKTTAPVAPTKTKAPRPHKHISKPPKTIVTATPGTISVHATVWGRVKIDGKAVGITPVNDYKLPPGQHTVELLAPHNNKVIATRRVEIKSGQRLKLKLD